MHHPNQNNPEFTTQVINDAMPSQHLLKPEFLRLPAPGRKCSTTGLTRSYLNQLILPCKYNGNKPPVKSYVMRRRGAKTGVRLIDRESLISYIRLHLETGSDEYIRGAEANVKEAL